MSPPGGDQPLLGEAPRPAGGPDLFVGTTGTIDVLYRKDGAGGFRRNERPRTT